MKKVLTLILATSLPLPATAEMLVLPKWSMCEGGTRACYTHRDAVLLLELDSELAQYREARLPEQIENLKLALGEEEKARGEVEKQVTLLRKNGEACYLSNVDLMRQVTALEVEKASSVSFGWYVAGGLLLFVGGAAAGMALSR